MALGAFTVRAQPPVRRVILFNRTPAFTDAFVAGLKDYGLDDPKKVIFENPQVAAEKFEMELKSAVGRNPDVMVLPGANGISAALRLTRRIPIVGIDLESDPVAAGFAKSLARPGGNATGIWLDMPELASKLFQFVREILPDIAAVGILWDDRIGGPQFAAAQASARANRITLHAAPVRAQSEAEAAVERLWQNGAKAVVALTAPVIFNSRERIVEVSLRRKLPLFSLFSAFPEAGGLLAYGPNLGGMFRQAAGFVHRILSGAKPAEMPIERPTRFELVVNRKTANVLGIKLPASLLTRADRVIE